MKPQELVESAARVTSNRSDSERTVWPTFDTVSSCENMCFADLLDLADAAYVDFTAIHPGNNNGVKNATVTSSGSDSEGTCVMPTFNTVSNWENVHSADMLALADAAYVNFTAIHPGSNNGVKDPFNPISRLQSDPLPSSSNMLFSHHNFSLEQALTITINDNPGEPQGVHNGCCRKTIPQFTPPTADEAMRGESRQVAGVQINLVEEEDIPSTKLDNNETPNNQELSEPVIESSVAAVSTPLEKNHNPDKGGSHGIGLNPSPLPEESSQNDSNSSSSGNLTTRLCMGVTKRKYFPNVQNKMKNKMRGERRQGFGMHINVTKEKTIPRTKLDRNKTPNNQELSEPVIESSMDAVSTPFKENHNLGNGGSLGIDLNQPSLPKEPRQFDSNKRRSGNLTTGLHMSAIKRKHSASTEQVDTRGMNLNGEHYSGLQRFQTILWDQFPIVRKKRSEKGPSPNTPTASSLSPRKDVRLATHPQQDCRTQRYASSSRCWISYRSKAVKVPHPFEALDKAIQTRPTERRCRAPTRFLDFAPLTTTRNCNILPGHFTKQLSNDVGRTDASLSAKGPMSNTSLTSFLSPRKDVRLATYPRQNDRTHRYASTSECLNSRENEAAKVPVTFEAVIHAMSQAFERNLSLCESQTRPTKRRSRAPTRFCDFASPTTRNCRILPSHFTKQLSNADRRTYEPSPSLDALVAEMCASLTKKKRTTKKKTTASSSSPRKDVRLATFPRKDALTHGNASGSKCLISCENQAAKVPLTFGATNRAIHDTSEAFERILSLCESQTRRTKRRSGATTRNFNFLPRHFTNQPSNADRRTFEPSPGLDALVAETRATLTKKKRTKKTKTNPPVSSAHPSRNKRQLHHKCLSKSLDAAHLHMKDALTEKFRHLNIVRDGAIRKPRPRPKR